MKQVYDWIRENHMIEAGDRIVAGVSGGADSVCLLRMLAELREELEFTLFAIHVEHGVRQEDGARDAAFTERLCETYQVPCKRVFYNVPQLAAEKGISVEEAGREVRYQAFEQYRMEIGADKIAVAHHRKDQAETILWHLVRGTGIAGLTGMKPVQGKLIRPLLLTSREEIERYLQERKQDWCQDVTNLENHYTRNRIRNQILPMMEEELNHQAEKHIAEAGTQLNEIYEYLKQQAIHTAGNCMALQKDALIIDCPKWSAAEPVLRKQMLLYGLEQIQAGRKDIGRKHLEMLDELAGSRKTGALDLPGRLYAKKQGKQLVIKKIQHEYTKAQEREEYQVSLEIPGEQFICGWQILCEKIVENEQNIEEKTYTKWMDYDKIKHGLVVRNRHPGDYLIINQKQEKKKLTRYLIDEKIPAERRNQILLVADGSHVVWIPGLRISEAYKITNATIHQMKIHMTEDGKCQKKFAFCFLKKK